MDVSGPRFIGAGLVGRLTAAATGWVSRRANPKSSTLQVPSPDRKDGDPPTLESNQGSNGDAAGPPPGPPNHNPLAFSSIAASRITP
jgi:hypothetical protein